MTDYSIAVIDELVQSLYDETAMWDADGVVGPLFLAAAHALDALNELRKIAEQ